MKFLRWMFISAAAQSVRNDGASRDWRAYDTPAWRALGYPDPLLCQRTTKEQTMPVGPGKYDDLCTHVRAQTNADGAIVIVFGGERGSGFSCQADINPTLSIPEILEYIAKQIRRDRAALGN